MSNSEVTVQSGWVVAWSWLIKEVFSKVSYCIVLIATIFSQLGFSSSRLSAQERLIMNLRWFIYLFICLFVDLWTEWMKLSEEVSLRRVKNWRDFWVDPELIIGKNVTLLGSTKLILYWVVLTNSSRKPVTLREMFRTVILTFLQM